MPETAKPRRAVLYARLSVTTEESVSIESQLEAGRNYCKAHGWEVVGEYKDDGKSAYKNKPEDRDGWKELLARPRGSYDVVVIRKIDRLARRITDFWNTYQDLEESGQTLASIADNLDMSTTIGRIVAGVLAGFAEMEAETISTRVRDARRYLTDNGRVPGGAAPFGYWNAPNPDGKGKVLAKDPMTIEFVEEAVARILRGDSVRSVALYLDEVAPRTSRKNSAANWTVTVTKRMLQNPVLAGMTLRNPGNSGKERGTEVLRGKNSMPVVREDIAVLSVKDWRTLQDLLTADRPYQTKTESYLSGVVWCGDCDRKMYRNAKTVHGKKVRVFQCQRPGGCGQQVTNLEGIVEERFLAEFATARFMRLVRTYGPDAVDVSEVTRQIEETGDRMKEPGADIAALAARMVQLQEYRDAIPEVEYRRELSEHTSGEEWAVDPRTALLERFEGVRLVKGGRGRNFDQTRLSFIERKAMTIKTLGAKHDMRVHTDR